MTVTEADLQKSIDDLSAAIDRRNEFCEQLVDALEYVCDLAEAAMKQANNDGGEYFIEAELSQSRNLIAEWKGKP